MADAEQRYIYVIGSAATPLVKIGTAADPSARLCAFQTGSPTPLTLLWTCPGGRDLELALHQHFANHRAHGEWFDLRPLGDTSIKVVESAVAVVTAALEESRAIPPAVPDWPKYDPERPYYLWLQQRAVKPEEGRCWCGHQAATHNPEPPHPCAGDCPWGNSSSWCLCTEYDESAEAIAEAEAYNAAHPLPPEIERLI
ncbi:GIY-YIG nuclease family protein [Streptomyces sp. A7024]|uniref:GIY-YIG nuclease family protein n=1 Tax=Streptomyces coryli TaxID=1128680 RepID=A0A6G4TVT6_9ACTN|nr:GIY-YIG nuclease family protein [Streptomyces coryli]NGN63157.1 GIY-YIG nuclease family protein [Streptomyces coryli]